MQLLRRNFSRHTLIELLQLALPMVVSQGTFAVMIFTDRYFMSQIDPTHMAAALGGGVASFFSFCFFVGLFSYANALAAQYLGAGEKDKCPKVVTQGIVMVLMSAPFLTLITFLVAGVFEAMEHAPAQVALERTYYLILMSGVLVTLAKACISSYFAGIGRTYVVMICDVFGLLINVPLCYIMVFGKLGFPAMGIVGAGVSTVVASLLALLLFIAFYFRREHRESFRVMRSFRLDMKILRRFWRLGFPSGLEMFLNVAAFNLFLLMFQSYGIAEGAGAAIVFNWDILSFVPMIGLHLGIISLIGRFVGARDLARANEVMVAGFVIGLAYSALLAILYITFRYPLVEVFAPPSGDFTAIRELSAFMMIGLSSYVMADAVILVSSGILRGAGDTRWLMVASVSLHWAMLVAQFFIIRVFELSPKVSWLAFVAMILAIALVYALRLKSGRWRDPAALERVMAE
ncbi:MAG: MATE family efflux transporter [Gammaproteobacteria bacterium]|nr:MATE family efflux transporter [Gammaproteobacteria bacterium]MDH5240936.1 MATE family efflux transporter [Gammaproteobacteria bacterium]MDH5261814.1 MATE family efflux transporter [Gammaproteobacteria bacterium]MDH5583329.1 MATE family efflux transporter [Gammaproteobacteria bacterium]